MVIHLLKLSLLGSHEGKPHWSGPLLCRDPQKDFGRVISVKLHDGSACSVCFHQELLVHFEENGRARTPRVPLADCGRDPARTRRHECTASCRHRINSLRTQKVGNPLAGDGFLEMLTDGFGDVPKRGTVHQPAVRKTVLVSTALAMAGDETLHEINQVWPENSRILHSGPSPGLLVGSLALVVFVGCFLELYLQKLRPVAQTSVEQSPKKRCACVPQIWHRKKCGTALFDVPLCS